MGKIKVWLFPPFLVNFSLVLRPQCTLKVTNSFLSITFSNVFSSRSIFDRLLKDSQTIGFAAAIVIFGVLRCLFSELHSTFLPHLSPSYSHPSSKLQVDGFINSIESFHPSTYLFQCFRENYCGDSYTPGSLCSI